jgi:hypothetical protein
MTGPATNLSNISGTISGNQCSYVTYYCLFLANGTNVDVVNNAFDHTINPGGSRTWGAGVRFYQPSAGFGARITGNTFTSNYVGIGVRQGTSEPAVDITGMDVYAHQNNFVGNTVAGLRHDGMGTFNATCNWWNSVSGPTNTGNPGGTGDAVDGAGPVNFSPWLFAPAPGDCFATRKECEKFYEDKKKDFEDMQKDQRKTFEDMQKTEKKNFDSTPHTKDQKKTFEECQKAEKKSFEEGQKTAKENFEQQNKANREQCKSLPK